MKLIIQPDAGVAPGCHGHQTGQEIHRRDHLPARSKRGHARARAAVGRGVNVRALIAHTHSGSDKVLRKLELRLLAAGVTVSRTADDLVRYHGKMMIIDERVLHVYGFNFTRLDIAKSRSLGVITKNRKLVQEALKLFKADDTRQTYVPGVRPVRRQPGKRPRAARDVHQRRAKAAADLRPAGQRRCDAAADQSSGSMPASTSGSSGRSRRSGRSPAKNFPAGGCTSAPSCATAGGPFSAARASAVSSSKSGARSASSSTTSAS